MSQEMNLYTAPGYSEPVDITTLSPDNLDYFMSLNPQPVKQQDSTAGAGVLSTNLAPTELESVNTSSASPSDEDCFEGSTDPNCLPENEYVQPIKKARTIETLSNQENVKSYDDFVMPNDFELSGIQLKVDEISLESYEVSTIKYQSYGTGEDNKFDRMGGADPGVETVSTVQPYETSMKIAKEYLKKNNIPLTKANVDKYTRKEIYGNMVFDLQKEKANMYFDKLDLGNFEDMQKTRRGEKIPQDQLFEDLDIRKQLQENKFEEDSRRLATAVNVFNDPSSANNLNLKSFLQAITDPGDMFKDIPENELVELENGNKVPKNVFEKYQNLIKVSNFQREYLLKQSDALIKLDKNVAQDYRNLDLVSRNYDLLDQALAVAAHSVMDASNSFDMFLLDAGDAITDLNVVEFWTIGGGTATEKYDNQKARKAWFRHQKDGINSYRKWSNEKLQKDYRHKVMFSQKINPFSKDGSWSDLGTFATLGLAGQTGTLLQLSMGTPGLYALGASTYGRTISDLEIADEQAGSTTGNLEKRLTALGYAISEVTLGALPTQRLLSNAFTHATAAEGKAFIGGIKNYMTGNWDMIPMSFATEYVSEGATGFVQNVIDITRGAKGMDQIMEGVPEQAFTGGLLGPMISSVPFVKGMVYSHFSTWNDMASYRDRAETIGILNKEIEGMDKRTTPYKMRVKMIEDLTSQNDALIQEKGKNILDNINPAGAKLYREALEYQEMLRVQAEALLKDNTMDPEVKAKQLKALKAEFDYYEVARNKWLSDFQNVFAVETNKVREEYLNKAASQLGLTRGIDSETKINEKATDLYEIDKIKTANDNAISLILTLGQGNVDVDYNYLDDNVILLAQLKEKLQELVEDGVYSQEKADAIYKEQSELINAGTVNGSNLRYKDSNGRDQNLIFVSEVNSLKNRRSQTPVHEITHTILAEAMANNPQAFEPLANSIMAYLAENNSAAYFRIDRKTTGQIAEEVLTVFIEEVASGRLNLEKNEETQNWTALFGAEISNAMGTENSFENVSDIVEFLKTLGYKINNGTFTLKDLKTIQEVGLPQPKGEAKSLDDIIKENLNESVNNKVVSEDEDLKLSQEVDSMSRAFDTIILGKKFRSNKDFVQDNNGRSLLEAFDVVDTNEQYNNYINSLITRDGNLGSLEPDVRQEINRQVKERVQDRIFKNYDPYVNGSFQSLFSFVYGNARGQGGRTQSALLDVKKEYITTPKASSLTTEAGGNFDVADTSKGADVILDEKLKGKIKLRSKLGQGLTLRGRKLIDIENAEGFSLLEQIEIAALETFEGKLPDVDSKKFNDFIFNMSADQKSIVRKAIQSRIKSTPDFKQTLKEFLPLYNNYPLSVLVQMDRNNSNKTLIEEVGRLTKPTEVDKAIAENKLPKNTNRLSGPMLYKHANPSIKQLNDFFFGDNVAPSTKGTRKDAFIKGLATQLMSDIAPSAARQAGLNPLKITKMAARLNVDPSIKFSYSNIFDLQLEGARKINTLLKDNKLNETIDFGKQVLTEKGRIKIVDLFKNDVVVLLPRLAWIGPQGANKFFGSGSDFGISMSTNKKGNIAVNRLREMMNDMLNDPKTVFGKPIKGYENGNFSVSSYSTIFKKNSTSSEIKEKADKFNDTVGLIHEALWERINASIQKDITTASGIASYLKLVANNTKHWHKLGAKIWGYSSDPKGITKIDKKGRSTTTIYEYEHAMPATAAYLFLMKSAIENASEKGIDNDFDAIYKLTMDNFKLIALDSAENKKLALAKLGRTMPKDWNLIDNVWWQRYFNEAMFGQLGGIDPRSVVDLNGKSMFDLFGIGSDGTQTTLQLLQDGDAAAKLNAKTYGIKLSIENSSNGQIQILKDYDTAASIARDLNAPVKKIRVFDFDDTLARTNSKVIVTMPNGKKSKINASEFAAKSIELQSNGALFDFVEFDKVIDGKKGPLFQLAKTMADAKGKRDIFVLTARPQASDVAIQEFLQGIGLNLPLSNITGLANGDPQAKANWVINKAAEGYNDFYFADDAIKNVKAVKEILDQIDVKSEVQLAKYSKEADIDKAFNGMIERSSGIKSYKEYSEAKSFRAAGTKGYNYFIPPSAEDFAGLMYPLYGKGKQGDKDMNWVKTNLLDPFNKAENSVTQAKISVANDYRKLKKNFKSIPKTLRTQAFDNFTYSDALRVSIWARQGVEIPGLSKADTKELVEFVENNEELSIFSNELVKIQKGKPYPSPGKDWLAGTITTDIMTGINKVNRAEYLQEWQQNIDIIFSEKNINKLRAAYGTNYVEALQNIIARMKTGSNRAQSSNKVVNEVTDWVNNSVGAIMFFNARSAVLQTLSAVNFINWSDNNILKAGIAFANQPQYWKDFMLLMNSDYLTARRNGLKINVSESEIADAVKGSQNKAKAAISYILSKGFLPTQFADSFAIASGGATFYRNRLNKYIKEGMPVDLAEQKAFLDFYEVAEETQQSARTDRISMEQASVAGRLILAFANTPMQYARLIKKASIDLKNGRGDWKTNVSKIVYYGLIQNLIFNALQNAMFAMMFDEDEEDLDKSELEIRKKKEETKALRIANGMADSILRGTGIYGAGVAALKNIIFELYNQSQKNNPKYEDAALELLSFSPPIDSKVTKFRSALRTFSWNAEEIRERGFDLKNPAYLASGQVISAFTNVPMDRVFRKINNVRAAGRADTEAWQSLALLAGWSEWELGVKDPDKYVKKKKKKEKKLKKFVL